MDELLIGSLLPGATSIHRQNINPVWRGNVQLTGIRRNMYVKRVDPRTLAVEVICAVVGRAIGLPIPRPALVMVTRRAMPELPHDTVFFGSESVANPDLKHWMERDVEGAIISLAKWSKLLDAGCFDEWVANADRHGGNLLYGGGSDFALVDHSEALPYGLSHPDPALANNLLLLAAEKKSAKQLEDLFNKAKKATQHYGDAQVHDSIRGILTGVCDHKTVDSLLAFLHQRIESLLMLISSRIGYGQHSLVLTK